MYKERDREREGENNVGFIVGKAKVSKVEERVDA
jgi:hypothetical protein